jgi:tetratricopeptide (TPR) repeat protein
MRIDRLRAAVAGVGTPPTARELAELIWLAEHLPAPTAQAPPGTAEEARPPPAPPARTPAPPTAPRAADPPRPQPAPAPASRAPERRTGLHQPSPAAADGEAAVRLLAPAAPVLAHRLELQRALRVLKRQVPSRRGYVLDEEETANRIADSRHWLPYLRPATERWLDVALVADRGDTMAMWTGLAAELHDTLAESGIFRDVSVWQLDGIRVTPAASASALRPASSLIRPDGRRLTLVLSDCCGPAWHSGAAGRVLRQWARSGPVAIVQPLPERMWRDTGAPTVVGACAPSGTCVPHTAYRFTPFDGMDGPSAGTLPVPVLEPARGWLARWARLVDGQAAEPMTVTFAGAEGLDPAAVSTVDLTAEQRVAHFRAVASPDAVRLAAYVATSTPTVEVIRLVQRAMLGDHSGPTVMAEVILGGLLHAVPNRPGRYRFADGVCDLLLDSITRDETERALDVLARVSAAMEPRLGREARSFRALVAAAGGDFGIDPAQGPFALVRPTALHRLGIDTSGTNAAVPRRRTVAPGPGRGPAAVIAPPHIAPPSRRVDPTRPDPDRSVAVLIDGLGGDGVDRLATVVTDPELVGIPDCRVTRSASVDLLEAAARTAEDTLFVFVAGRQPLIDAAVRALSRSRARRRVLIADGGTAGELTPGAADHDYVVSAGSTSGRPSLAAMFADVIAAGGAHGIDALTVDDVAGLVGTRYAVSLTQRALFGTDPFHLTRNAGRHRQPAGGMAPADRMVRVMHADGPALPGVVLGGGLVLAAGELTDADAYVVRRDDAARERATIAARSLGLTMLRIDDERDPLVRWGRQVAGGELDGELLSIGDPPATVRLARAGEGSMIKGPARDTRPGAVFRGEVLLGIVHGGPKPPYQYASAPHLFDDGVLGFALHSSYGQLPQVEAVELSALLLPHHLAGEPVSPTQLLRVEAGVVPFEGRTQEMSALDGWMAGDGTRVLALTGPTGQGKTRLAQELAERMRRHGWSVGLLAESITEDVDLTPLRAMPTPVLVVVSDTPVHTGTVARLLATPASDSARPLRVLLVANGQAGEWWNALREAMPPEVQASTMTLEPHDATERAEMFRAAATAFAELLSTMDGYRGLDWPRLATVLDVPDLSDPAYEPILVVQATALATVLEAGLPGGAVEGESIEDRLLRHEARYWVVSANAHGLHLTPETCRAAVAQATMWGAGDREEAVATAARIATDVDPQRLADWLRAVYPLRESAYWGRLRPGRLGERLVVRHLVAHGPPAAADFAVTSPRQNTRLLTTLAAAAVHQPEAHPLIVALVMAHPDRLAVPATVLATTAAVPGPFVEGVQRVLSGDPDPDLLREVYRAIPERSVPLATVAVTAAELLVGYDRRRAFVKEDPAVLVGTLTQLSLRLAAVGRYEEAVGPAEEAVKHQRRVTKGDPERGLPALATCLFNLSNRMGQVGDSRQALTAVEEALRIQEGLAARDPDRYATGLASMLVNYASLLSEQGRAEAAFAAAVEAVAAWRRLAAQDSRRVQGLAAALSVYASLLQAQGDQTLALNMLEEAVSIRRQLAASWPDAHESDLATSLSNLSTWLAEGGDAAGAMAATDEAIAIFRRLGAQQPLAYTVPLAHALTNLANLHLQNEAPDPAFAAANEAVHLIENSPTGRRQSEGFLAAALLSRGFAQFNRGEVAEGLADTARSIEHLASTGDEFDLAFARYAYGEMLGYANRSEEAIAPLLDALRVFDRLGRTDLVAAVVDQLRTIAPERLHQLLSAAGLGHLAGPVNPEFERPPTSSPPSYPKPMIDVVEPESDPSYREGPWYEPDDAGGWAGPSRPA